MADVGSGTSRSTADIAPQLNGTHGHLARIHVSSHGTVAKRYRGR